MTTEPDLAFSREEYAQRLASIRRIMAERGADMLIIDETEHLAYLTGFGPSATMYQACIVPLTTEPVMVLRRLDEPSFFECSWISDTVSFGDGEDPVAAVIATLRQRDWASGRIGFELDSHYLPVRTYQHLVAGLPEATIVDCSRAIWELRLRKSPAEIDYLRRASAIADEALRQAVVVAGAGSSERAAAIAASRAFLEGGADSGHVGRITSGSRTASLHGALRDHPLAAGDIMHLELVPQVRGYSARLMRPVVVGSPAADQAALARRLIEIQDRQFAALRPGVLAREVDAIARDGVLAAGLRDRYDNSTGYTLGLLRQPAPGAVERFHADLRADRGLAAGGRHGLPHVPQCAGHGLQRHGAHHRVRPRAIDADEPPAVHVLTGRRPNPGRSHRCGLDLDRIAAFRRRRRSQRPRRDRDRADPLRRLRLPATLPAPWAGNGGVTRRVATTPPLTW